MSVFLQPVLVPVKGAPDIILSIDPKNPEELFVFLGMALLEKIPRLQEHLGFKMLLARLYNAGVSGVTRHLKPWQRGYVFEKLNRGHVTVVP